MNVKFRTSLSGFNREEVIEYIRKLAAEKHRAENAALESSNKLDDAEYRIIQLKEEIEGRDEKIEILEADISEMESLIAKQKEEISKLSEKLTNLKHEYKLNIIPASKKASEAEAELRGMASELSELSDRVKKAHLDISGAVVTIEDFTRE